LTSGLGLEGTGDSLDSLSGDWKMVLRLSLGAEGVADAAHSEERGVAGAKKVLVDACTAASAGD